MKTTKTAGRKIEHKSMWTVETDLESNKTITIKILASDLIKAPPSNFARAAKETYERTGTFSDWLFYLSEEIKSLEDSMTTERNKRK